MRLRSAAVAGVALGLMSGAAKAAYIINVDQVGSNVVATGSGSLNLAGLTAAGTFPVGSLSIAIDPAIGFLTIGGDTDFTEYTGFSGPSSFGSPVPTYTSIHDGGSFGISVSQGLLVVASDYKSGADAGLSTATFDNTTLAGLGAAAGTYTYKFGSGATADTFTIQVGTVPLPASAQLLGVALMTLGAAGYGLKRRKATA